MPGEAVQVRKEPVRGLKPLFMGAVASTTLFLSACAPVQLALDRMGSARNTSFKPTSSCPSIEGDVKNATFFLVENTTSFKIDGGLTFKGKAYTNGHYVMCMMENATNAYVLESDGTVVAILTKAKNGRYMNGTEGVLRQTKDGGFELVSESDYIFGNTFGKFATRRSAGAILSTPQISPTVISQPRGQENNDRIDFIADEVEYSQPLLIIGGVVVMLGMAIIVGAVIKRSREFDKANQERWSQGKSTISDIGHPDPELIRKIPSPIYPLPQKNKPLPPIIIQEETESLMDNV